MATYVLISGAGGDGHMVALSRPAELAGRLEVYRQEAHCDRRGAAP